MNNILQTFTKSYIKFYYYIGIYIGKIYKVLILYWNFYNFTENQLLHNVTLNLHNFN